MFICAHPNRRRVSDPLSFDVTEASCTVAYKDRRHERPYRSKVKSINITQTLYKPPEGSGNFFNKEIQIREIALRKS